MKFQLKLYDQTLLTFDYSENSERQENCKILDYDKLNTQLLPIGLELADDGLLTWLKQRVIPKNREFVETILSRMGLSRNNTMGIIQI